MTYRPCKQYGNWHDDGSADYCLDCIDNGIFEVPVIMDEFDSLLVTDELKQAFSEHYSHICKKGADNNADVYM